MHVQGVSTVGPNRRGSGTRNGRSDSDAYDSVWQIRRLRRLTVLTVPLYLSAVRRLTGNWYRAVSKTGMPARASWVRIPPCPLELRSFPPPFHRPVGHSFGQRTSGLETVMTQKKHPGGQQRGWIVP